MKLDINLHIHGDPAIERRLASILDALVNQNRKIDAMATRDQEVLDLLTGIGTDLAAVKTVVAKVDTDVTTLINAATNGQQPDGSITPAGAQAIFDAANILKASLADLKSAADAVDARTPDPAT